MRNDRLRLFVEGTGIILTLTLVTGCDWGRPVPPREDPNAANRAVESSATNNGDRARQSSTSTAEAQRGADSAITAKVHQAITDDAAMSDFAKQCKVVTLNGVVTLEGVVATQEEKDLLEAKVKAIGGVTKVTNRLEVKTS